MDVQTQDAVCVSEKEQHLTAPPGWTKKLVPASAKSITLRKYDVVFIAPDGQEVKSKWHLNRYLKAHPEGPASSEFIWSTGEEAPIRRSTRFATKEASEDSKTTSRKKGKRNASEMEAEETDYHDEEKAASKKRAKKAGKSAALDENKAVDEDAANDLEKDEVMHEAIASDNEATQAAPQIDEVQKDEKLAEVEASKEAVTEKATDEELNTQENAEKVSGSTIEGENEDIQLKDEGLDKQVEAENATIEGEHADIQLEGEGLDKQVEAENATSEGEHVDIQLEGEALDKQVEAEMASVSSVVIVEEHEEIQVTVVEAKEVLNDNGLHADNECKATQETDTFVASAEEFKVEEAAMGTKVMELEEHFGQKVEENEDVSCKITVISPVVEELAEGNDKPSELKIQEEVPLELPMPKEDLLEPLMQKEVPLESPTPKEDLVELLMQREVPLESPTPKEDLVELWMQKEVPLESPTPKEDSVEPLMQKEVLLESPTPKEDSVEPLMQKEEQERLAHIQNSPLKVEHVNDKSPSEFSSSPVPVTVAK